MDVNILLSIGLAMDAFAVSIACGLNVKKNLVNKALIAGVSFGFFQGFMAFIGWYLGSGVAVYIESFDHWVAFMLLAYIGGSMIIGHKNEDQNINLDTFKTVIILSIATSIDAIIAGVTLSFVTNIIFVTIIMITVITLFLSFTGVILGAKIKAIAKHQDKIGVIGGLILIGMGLKILIEHIYM